MRHSERFPYVLSVFVHCGMVLQSLGPTNCLGSLREVQLLGLPVSFSLFANQAL